jgi:hypothetical protein
VTFREQKASGADSAAEDVVHKRLLRWSRRGRWPTCSSEGLSVRAALAGPARCDLGQTESVTSADRFQGSSLKEGLASAAPCTRRNPVWA